MSIEHVQRGKVAVVGLGMCLTPTWLETHVPCSSRYLGDHRTQEPDRTRLRGHRIREERVYRRIMAEELGSKSDYGFERFYPSHIPIGFTLMCAK